MKRVLVGVAVVVGLSVQLGLGIRLLTSSRAEVARAQAALDAAEAARDRASALADAQAADQRSAEARRAREALAAEVAAEEARVALIRTERDAAATLEALSARTRADRARTASASVACLEQARRDEAEARELADLEYRERLRTLALEEATRARAQRGAFAQEPIGAVRGGALSASETVAFAAVREAVLGGDDSAATRAVQKFNEGVRDGPALVLHGDASRRLGIELGAVYATNGARFEVSLAATGKEPARLIVAPGTRVKSVGDLQDTTVVDLMVIDVKTSRTRELPAATVCCVDIRKNDPRVRAPVALDRHPKDDVVTVARFAARERADWTTTQVALWAVANDCSRGELMGHAPGNVVPAARDLLERSGIDTNGLALFRGEAPRPRAGELLDAPRLRLGRRG